MLNKKNGPLESLKNFKGAKGDTPKARENSLNEPFMEIARQLLYGGYFEVRSNGKTIRKVYLHTVEFYYHDEIPNGVKDYIVYHRNSEDPSKPLVPALPIGSLNTHISGIDIAFEDNRHKEPQYRASVLIRAFQVAEGDKVLQSISSTLPVETRSTYLYQALFMGVNVLDSALNIEWISDEIKKDSPILRKVRKNVGEFEPATHKRGFIYHKKKDPFVQDPRLWSFYKG